MQDFEFSQWAAIPVALILGAAIIAGFWFYQSAKRPVRKDKNTVLVANSVRMRQSAAYQAALKKLWVRIMAVAAVAVLAGSAAAFGVAKPTGISVTRPEKNNRDIVLCLDASGSMLDIDSDILATFKDMAKDFHGERIALTVFNSNAMQVFPLTDDYSYIETQLNRVINIFKLNYTDPQSSAFLANTLNSQSGASLIGDGLYGCSRSFDNLTDTKRSRSIVFATDNVANGKEHIPLDKAAQMLKQQNVRVYGINPGTRGTGIEAVPDSAVAAMKANVELTGGKFFLLKDNNTTDQIVKEISSTETSMIQGNPMIIKQDQPTMILYGVAGLFVLLTGLMIWRKL